MKNVVKSISRLLILLVIAACSTTGTIKNKQLSKTDDSYITLAKELTAAPKNPELTADVKIKIGMGSYDATLMMRWNESIRISVTPLGIMEIMRLECLPDMIVFVDRTSSRYAVEHYADVPYRNITGLDFYSLQALLWNKIFVPGYTDIESVVQRIRLSEMGEHGTLFSSTEYDYNFTVDKSGKLVQTSKESLVYSVAANYLDFKPVADGVVFSLVEFNGNPFDANIHLICHHTINSVPLSDLTSTTAFTQNNKVKVIGILDITGKLGNMDFKFDMNIPNVSEEVRQLVRSMINSEEEMNTQMIYLLGLGRFYPNEYARNNGAP